MREGWALDYRKYSTDCLQAESAAKRDGAGLWRRVYAALGVACRAALTRAASVVL
jgi:endonuclease YncB( thermonuclease family)